MTLGGYACADDNQACKDCICCFVLIQVVLITAAALDRVQGLSCLRNSQNAEKLTAAFCLVQEYFETSAITAVPRSSLRRGRRGAESVSAKSDESYVAVVENPQTSAQNLVTYGVAATVGARGEHATPDEEEMPQMNPV